VQELRRRTHEANNAFSTALLTAQYLLDQSRAEPFSDAVRAELVSAASGMVEALQKLRGQLDRGPRSSTTAGARSPLVQAVELGPALERCTERIRRRHPQVSVELVTPDRAIRAARVGICGGDVGLERALCGAIEHAADRARSKVEVRVTAQLGVDVLAIEIADDGPGFAEDALARPIAAFEEGEPDESGLGLYTAERIVRASLGSLRRENAPSGGGRVALFVPLATETR
jgi:K+-sensing histidine kinase KdpD